MTITSRHKKLAKNVGKYGTEEEAAIKAHYSPSYARNGGVKKTKGWQELMEKALPDSLLLKVHKEGLVATKSENRRTVDDYPTRHKYLDTAYKIKGKVVEKRDITSDGKPIQQPLVNLNALFNNDSSKKGSEAK